MNPIDRITKVIDQISIWSGKAISWLIIPMIAVLGWEVFIRYVDRPTLWAVDIATMTYGTHFFIAGAMTLCMGKHIRTDFFYGKWSPKTQAWVDVICYLFLFLPGMVMFAWLSWDFFAESWDLKEKLMTTWRPPHTFISWSSTACCPFLARRSAAHGRRRTHETLSPGHPPRPRRRVRVRRAARPARAHGG